MVPPIPLDTLGFFWFHSAAVLAPAWCLLSFVMINSHCEGTIKIYLDCHIILIEIIYKYTQTSGKRIHARDISQHGTTVGVVTFVMRPREARWIVDSFKSHWLYLHGLLNPQVSFPLWDTLLWILCTAIPQQITPGTHRQLYVLTKVPLREDWTSLWSLAYSDTAMKFLLRWKGRTQLHSYKKHQSCPHPLKYESHP